MIIVLAQAAISDQALATLEGELAALARSTQREPGCLSYDLVRGAHAPDLLMAVERWATAADLDRHLARPDVQAILARLAAVADRPPVIDRFEVREG